MLARALGQAHPSNKLPAALLWAPWPYALMVLLFCCAEPLCAWRRRGGVPMTASQESEKRHEDAAYERRMRLHKAPPTLKMCSYQGALMAPMTPAAPSHVHIRCGCLKPCCICTRLGPCSISSAQDMPTPDAQP